MTRSLPIFAALCALAAPALAVSAQTQEPAPHSPGSRGQPYAPPPETSRFIDGQGVDLTRRYCLSCHSADYVSTQPPHMPPSFWQTEVAKMRNNYGAIIPDDAAKAIADYLVATYTEPSAGRK